MTRKEAVDFLGKCRWWFEPFTSEKEQWNEALDIAIEALTQEPTQDLISRQDAINAVGRFRNIDGISVWHNGIKESIRIAIIEDLAKLPSADRPTGEWVSEDGTPSGAAYSVYCSRCGQWSEYRGFFCLWCGAKMGGDNDGNDLRDQQP